MVLHSKTQWLSRALSLTALLSILLMFFTPLGTSAAELCTSAVLTAAYLLGGLSTGLFLALAAPPLAWLFGVGAAVPLLIPGLILGNLVYLLLLCFCRGRFFPDLLLILPAAGMKALLLYLTVELFLASMLSLPSTGVFSLRQLLSCAGGGLLGVCCVRLYGPKKEPPQPDPDPLQDGSSH